MKWFINLIPYGLATAVIILASAIISNVTGTSPAISQSTGEDQIAPTSTNTEPAELTTSPRRLTVTVKVAEPTDLKIAEGQEIKRGDIISDRISEKTRLTSQQKQLQLSLDRLKSASITPPASPAPVPPVMALPPVSYLEHTAAVEKTKAALLRTRVSETASITSELDLKNQEIDYLSQVPNLDPIILEHEQTKLAELKQKHTAAVRDYQLAMGKLQSAKDNRKYQEYQASVTEAQRIEQMNQARLHYQQQLAQYEQRLADREFQVSQLQARLNDVNNAIASLSVVKAPYAGTVRRIRWLGQSPDGSLTAEVTLMVGNSEQSTASLSDEQ
jgi:biotin carboxyl carrier protein